MSKVPWHVFRSDHPRAHLVAASIAAAEMVGSPDLKSAKAVLERLVKTLAPTGDYATSIVRETGEPEVHLAFENEPDARKLADSVRAAMTDRYPGWASQRAFELDAAAVDALASGLPLLRRRPPKSSGSSGS
ncbi:MAG TPA: hypothetical protein VK777_01890 [Reyranella sp.]|nr:hypothetical protein [Reyranella sp.]